MQSQCVVVCIPNVSMIYAAVLSDQSLSGSKQKECACEVLEGWLPRSFGGVILGEE